MEDFEQLVRGRSAALLRTAFLLTGERQAAEDLLQEALARAAERWEGVRRHPGGAEAYVRRVLVTRSIDAWRGRRVRDRAERDATRRGSPVPDDAPETRLDLQAALARLTARQRAVLVLRFYDDLTEVQTAAALGCSTSTVKSHTRDALAHLRRLAPDLDPAPTVDPAARPDRSEAT